MALRSSRVGVRELRQNLSHYLERIARGETFEVTDRSVPVAHLTPLPAVRTRLGNLIATGRARPARGELVDLAPPKVTAPESPSRALAAMRSTLALSNDAEPSALS
jgi:prevent-host-death family protein